MKIVDRKTFLKLPEGTVYTTYVPHYFGPLEIKTKTYHTGPHAHPSSRGDWYAISLNHPCFGDDSDHDLDTYEAMEKGASVPVLEWLEVKDGDQLSEDKFAILEDADLLKMIELLKGGLYK